VAVLGAGNYAGRVLIPELARSGARLLGIASQGGVTAARLGRKYGFSTVSTDPGTLLSDPQINTVVVATRHDTHATFVQQGLTAGKHVFVEKPLAITASEIEGIESALARSPGPHRPLLMVGFNRRFAPLSVHMKTLLQQQGAPKSFIVTVNAGAVPAGHWTQAAEVGGGRIIGECCHFIDLLRFLAGTPIVHWDLATTAAAGGEPDTPATITLIFADGSMGTVHYFPNGHASFPKERVEAFCAGRILQLDNFRTLRGFGWGGLGAPRSWRQDKGHSACVAEFLAAVRSGGDSPIPLEEILEVSRVSVAVGVAARRPGADTTCRR
jgi:predicted dehydrogenase